MGLRPVINVAGTMTSLGGCIVRPEVTAAAVEILPYFVEIDDLQRRASAAIAKATGAEAGCVTGCASAALSISVAGTMTGANLAHIEQLPDTAGMRNEVIMQTGHWCQYSAPVDQAVRLTGATARLVGTVNEAREDQLAAAINERTAAMLFVVSHQTAQHGQIPLELAAEVCRAHAIPLIADVAAEYDLRGFLSRGADLAVYSAHKFLGGMTGGIVAGRKELVRAAYLQSAGIGRGMKVGKEGIVGAITALDTWQQRDHAAERAAQQQIIAEWQAALAGIAGIDVSLSPDPTANPIERLRLTFQPAEPGRAAHVATRLAAGDPPIVVRDEFLDLNIFELDPCNLHPGEATIVAARLQEALKAPPPTDYDPTAEHRAAHARRLAWPD